MFQLRLLGPIELRDADDSEIREVLVQPKRLALLAYLAAARPAGLHRRDTLLAMFWPEMDEFHGRQALKQAVSFLRHALGTGDRVVAGRGADEIGIDHHNLSCDAAAFSEYVSAGRYEDALALYRGDLLEGFFADGAPGFQDWLDRERMYLRGLAAHAAHQLAQQYERDGRIALAVTCAQRALNLSDLDERVLRHLLALLDRVGDRAAAVRTYERFARRLAHEYETVPAAETLALIDGIRRRVDVRPGASVDVAAPAASDARALPAVARARERRLPSRRITAGIAAAFLTIAALAIALRERDKTPAVGGSVIAVLPPVVTGTGGLANAKHFAELVYVISYNLDNARGVRAANAAAVMSLVDRRGGPSALVDQNVARAITREAGAGYYLQTTIIDRGDRLKILASLHPLVVQPGDTVFHVEAEGDADRFDALLSRITGLVVAARERGRVARFDNLAARTTDSLPALYAYLDGERLFRERRLDSSMAAFRRAVDIDSAFALAYYRMAVVGSWGAGGDSSALTRALRYKHRLPERYQALVMAFDAFASGRAAQAESLYTRIVGRYPDDREAWFYLGDVIFHYGVPWGRPLRDARVAFEHALGPDSADAEPLNHLVWIAALETHFDEAALLAARVTTHELGEFNVVARTALAFHARDAKREADVLRDLGARATPPFVSMAAGWASYVGSFEGSERVAGLLATGSRDAVWQARGHMMTADLELARGRRAQAAAARDRVAIAAPSWGVRGHLLYALSPPVLDHSSATAIRTLRDSVAIVPRHTADDSLRASYVVGILSARLHDSAAAVAGTHDLEAVARRTPRLSSEASDLALTIDAESARQAGRLEYALAIHEGRHPDRWWAQVPEDALQAQSYERWTRAELLAEVGRTEEAICWYAPLGMWSPGRDVAYVAPSRLRLAEMYERLGRREEAIEQYRRFAELWKDADPELQPTVIAARERLARLAALPALPTRDRPRED